MSARRNAFAVSFLAAAALAGCSGSGSQLPAGAVPATGGRAEAIRNAPGLGKILTTKDGGQIFGFDIDQNGNDAILAEATSVDVFNQDTGRITNVFARSDGQRNSFSLDGIAAGDVALVTHYIVPKGQIYARRKYQTVNPVPAHRFTGVWTPPIGDVNVESLAENQATGTSVAFAIELKQQDRPVLFVSNVAADTFSLTIHLDANLFGLADGPQLGQYTAGNEAVMALSPDGGAAGGQAPLNVLFDLTTGKSTQFSGYNNGPFHAGYVNGLAVDPNTGVAVTDTELNAQVEFYDLNKHAGITAVQLPCTGPADQSNSGAGITVDAKNKLFLVTDPFYCNGSQDSAVVVYDEAGNVVESITGFKFAIGEPPVAINPSKRMGWAFGPGFSQLQQFFY
jgi:hypothetical protein